jgi:hypothetical protein
MIQVRVFFDVSIAITLAAEATDQFITTFSQRQTAITAIGSHHSNAQSAGLSD